MGGQAAIRQGDCVEVMRSMDECSVDAIVTDPPYDLVSVTKRFGGPTARNTPAMETEVGGVWARKARGFMGKTWDGTGIAFQPETWAEALRVLKPGGHLLAFGGTRTFHRLTVAIEDAGFEIRDCLMWLYGSGFPKSLDVSKAIDKVAGAKREKIGAGRTGSGRTAMNDAPGNGRARDYLAGNYDVTAPATDLAKKWQGWGTALKPAWEPIILARKPLIGTVAENVEKYGTGALNIDGTRIAGAPRVTGTRNPDASSGSGNVYRGSDGRRQMAYDANPPSGRWPANVILDEEAAAILDAMAGVRKSGKMMPTHTDALRTVYGQNAEGGYVTMETYGDSGGASRFFYVAKASKKDRGEGNTHPTVKPTELMRWLVRLVTPPDGVVLDPFAGSGTTAVACEAEGLRCVLIERDSDYVAIAERRLAA